MIEERIQVIAYAGYRSEESPRIFSLQGKQIEVLKILGQWTEEDSATRERKRCFKVKGNDFRSHTLCYDEGAKEWHERTAKRKEPAEP